MKSLVAFDLDGTLAQSKQPLSTEMSAALASLLSVVDVAVISGGDWPQFEKQVASRLPNDSPIERLWLMPTTGTKLYRFIDAAWRPIYAELFDEGERAAILSAFDDALSYTGLSEEQIWGERIEDRGSQITFSGLGQAAPLKEKEAWDPDRKKRTALQTRLRRALPDLSINLGGTTSIDVTRAGVDKGYGLKRLSNESMIELDDMLFIGDAIYPGGNDYPAAEIGLDTVKVHNIGETTAAIAAIVACLRERANHHD
ncbi:HAD-IIB family hydrolase [Sphingomonas crocodyli]|uniref:phosphomannomutase n=1 Tax=Sphingomonas crocodyli TaxID=1979270 RepID=A0A437M5X1_9SPHN|nr:HAD-IIB family hydrolase [Sphingomonas crocodyli]RVT93108.1 HAD-IIB family hydrolase [Sphingomonas crocodyli]